MQGWIKRGLALAGLPLAVVAVPFLEYRPEDRESVEVFYPNRGEPLSAGRPIRLVSWNIQFSGSRREAFFYDGGPAVHVDPAIQEETLQGLLSALRALKPDLAALQEVDRDSRRTSRVDQLRRLLAYRDGLSWASAPYFRVPFVPAPFKNPLGRMDMHLCWMSAPPLQDATRVQLALLKESRLRQMFNLKRALLTAAVPLQDGRTLQIANTHLSAFSFGDGTLDKQVAALKAWMERHPPDQPWILAGDFNLLPPGDEPARLNLDRDLYGGTNPIEALMPRFQTAFDPLAAANRTYLPHGVDIPERKIDYVFYGGPIRIVDARVAQEHNQLSDHLPLVVDFSVQPA